MNSIRKPYAVIIVEPDDTFEVKQFEQYKEAFIAYKDTEIEPLQSKYLIYFPWGIIYYKE